MKNQSAESCLANLGRRGVTHPRLAMFWRSKFVLIHRRRTGQCSYLIYGTNMSCARRGVKVVSRYMVSSACAAIPCHRHFGSKDLRCRRLYQFTHLSGSRPSWVWRTDSAQSWHTSNPALKFFLGVLPPKVNGCFG